MSKRRTNKKESVEPLAAKKTYEVKEEFPDGKPNLVVVLRGLLLLAFKGKEQCEIGAVETSHRHTEKDAPSLWDQDMGCRQVQR